MLIWNSIPPTSDKAADVVVVGTISARLERRARGGDGDAASPSPAATRSAYARRNRRAARNTARDTEPARATPTAHALGKDGMRVGARRGDAAHRGDDHVPAHPSGSTLAAHAQAHRRHAADSARRANAAIAAAPANALGQDAIGAITRSADRIAGGHGDVAGAGTAATRAAKSRADCGTAADSARDAEPARTTATSHALGEDGVRIVANRRDLALTVDGDVAGRAPACGGAAKTQWR